MAEGKRDLLVVAVQKHKPKEEDDLGSEQAMNTSPGVAAQLSVEIGEKFEVLGRDVDCWLYEKHVGSGEEGYIPSTCVDLTQEDEDKIAKGAENLVLDALVEAENRKPCPEDSANIFSRLGFMWLTSLIFKGFKKPLTDADLWALNKTKRSSTVVPPFVKKWKEAESSISVSGSFQITEPTDNEKAELKPDDAEEDVKFSFEGKKKEKRPSLSRIMFEIYWDKLLLAVFLKLLNDCFEFVQPQLLRLLIDFIEDRDNTETWRGYTYGVSMLVVALVKSTCLQQYFHVVTVLGMEIRTAVIGMVYSKALSLNNSSRKISTSGEIVNLMSVDAQQLMDLLTYVNILWSGPLQIIVSLSFLYSTMGPSILAGVGVLLLLIPFNILVSRLSRKYQLELMVAKDKRIKMMNEILNGIKILKLYAWETPFMEMVSRIRETELRHLMKLFCLDASFIFTSSCAPFLVSLATFAIYVMTGNELTASKAFFAISLLNILRFPLVMFPNVIISLSKARVSIARLTEFLFLEELDSENVAKNMPEHISTQDIHVENGSFSWDKNSEPALQEINISIPSGSLVAVVGQVGCGKSTLISALLGETEKLDGRVYLKGSVAYVPQQAWIQSATLRDNILFGRTFESKRYAETIYTCALQSDIEILLGGDLTEIGERGINLSGGQKQRVSLARAVYFNADIYLLDDPLSAVDSRVGKHIFDEVIGPRGKLRMKTRILVTHGIAFLPQVDQIIVLQDGRISELGTYTELIEKKGAFAEFLKRYATKEQAKLEYEPSSEIVKEESAKVDGQFSSRLSLERLDSHPDVQRLKRAESMSEQTDRMIEEEKSQTGRVKLKVFWAYAKSLTVPLSIWVLLALIFAEANSVSMGISLARWSSTEVTSDDERNRFLGIYSFLGVSKCLIVAMQPLVLAMGTIKASRHFHQRMLENILHSPMSFFETTSEGRIVNRFSKDISSIDDIVPKTVSSFLRTFLAVIASIFTICFATPIVLVIVVPLGVLYIFIQRIFVASSRELKRIESVSRSPIYNNFLETINGTSTIRAFAQQQRFIQGNYVIVDENQVSCYPLISSNRWLAVRLELIGILITFFAAVFAVLRRNSLQSGLVGLSVTYALQVTQTLYWLVRMSSDLETNIVSVERVKEYSETPTEAKWIIPDNRPPEDWPQAGNIVIKEFDLKYREGLPLVLMQIDCDIKPGERVGIVGRTGKSALTLALFRILERAGGRIVIDGVDIAKIGLQDLRSRLAIIPQDPVLFSGTLRFNLDPFDSHTDKELWKILEMSHLKNFVSGLEKGLLHPVTEGGENLSVGQRQLVCLARALLRESKILVLDETTAAVDLETDELIQHMIRREFADRTVFTIAHRLNTIMDYTRIMVLDKGFLVEFDTPRALLAQKGIFYKMARDAGLARVTR